MKKFAKTEASTTATPVVTGYTVIQREQKHPDESGSMNKMIQK